MTDGLSIKAAGSNLAYASDRRPLEGARSIEGARQSFVPLVARHLVDLSGNNRSITVAVHGLVNIVGLFTVTSQLIV